MQQRVERVSVLVQQSVGKNLHRLFPQSHLTVTRVDVSADLKHATAWISQLKQVQSDPEALMEQIKEQSDQLQQALASSLKTKFTPRLRFRFDSGTDHAGRIDEILSRL